MQTYIAVSYTHLDVYKRQAYSQQQTTTINGDMVPVGVYKGDTIPAVQLPNVYIFRCV